jgi:hypothetical protein
LGVELGNKKKVELWHDDGKATVHSFSEEKKQKKENSIYE